MYKRFLITSLIVMGICYPGQQARASEEAEVLMSHTASHSAPSVDVTAPQLPERKEVPVARVHQEGYSPTIIWAGPTPCTDDRGTVFKQFFKAGGYEHFMIANATINPQTVKNILFMYADNMSIQNQCTGIFKGPVTLGPQSMILFSLKGKNPLYLGFNSLYINGKEVRIGLRGQQAAATLYCTIFLTSDKAKKQPEYNAYFDESGLERREVFVGTFLYVAPVYTGENDIVCCGPVIPRARCDTDEEYRAQFERYVAEGGKVSTDWIIKHTAYQKQIVGNIHLTYGDILDPTSFKTGIIKDPITLEAEREIMFSIKGKNPIYKGLTAMDVNGSPVTIGFKGPVAPGLLYPKVLLTIDRRKDRALLKTDFEGDNPINTAEIGTQ